MMDQGEVLAELNQERRRLARDGEIVEVLPSVTRVRANDRSHHVVIYASLTKETADAVIDEQIEHHARLGVDFEWKLYAHDAPSDMLQRLERRGFHVGPREAVLVREHRAGDGGTAKPASPVVRIERADQIADYRRVAEAVFAKNYDFTINQLANALRTGCQQHRGYVAYADRRPVSIGRLYTHPDSLFAGLYGGGTLEAYRGQGFYRALVAARARDAAELGARYLLVDALPTSRPILERMGFRRITDTWPCEWRRSCAP
jgi:GNAT superfamily N-acetyltransferase